MVKPRNLFLFSCHAANETVQLTLLGKKFLHEQRKKYVVLCSLIAINS